MDRLLVHKEIEKMKSIKVTMQEIYDAMKPSVHRNKKKYTRKNKHKGKDEQQEKS